MPVFRAWQTGGIEGARAVLGELGAGIQLAMMLTGSPTVAELAKRPVVLGPRLREWMDGIDPSLEGSRGS
ncbi:MAG: hypothetical protein HY901_13720 [Deltaproteobacteria bacterium]|nr:hypothetical protein [Deltaproteobacteria bacterium]